MLGSMSEGGHPLDWFVDPVDESLVCAICKKVLQHPRSTPCGHVFCLHCLRSWERRHDIKNNEKENRATDDGGGDGGADETDGGRGEPGAKTTSQQQLRAQQRACCPTCNAAVPEGAELIGRAIDLEHLIEQRTSALLTRCRNSKLGCEARITLSDKRAHEKQCTHRPKGASVPRNRLLASAAASAKLSEIRRVKSCSEDDLQERGIHRRYKAIGGANLASSFSGLLADQRMAATRALHTFRLKRSKARESLGLVLISGPKTALGFTEYFLVKDVKPGTLAFKAGVHPGDRIVQIDNLDLTRLAPFEAVSRIKDKQVVIVTVERDTVVPLKGSSNHHIYDEVLYSDLLQHLSLSQDDPGFPQGGPMYSSRARNGRRGGGRLSEDGLLLSPGGHSRQNAPRPVSPLTRPSHQFQQQQQQQKTQVTENSNSKDSGLSTGSSGSPRPTFRKQGGDGSGGGDKPSLQHSTQQPHQHSRREDGSPSPTPTPYYHQLDRGTGARHSYRTEREMLRGHLKDPRKAGQSSSHGQRPNHDHFFDGDYVIEEIYLAKDGTNQLGITLGYDTKTSKGQLIVCEVLPDGLAAIDGRIRSGDIIKKVNGFEVYDPEEAILLFLEQDQDITLTIARKHSNNVSSRRGSAKGRGRASAVSTDMRRVDSCGSLDSHSHQYHHLTNETDETLLVRCDGDGGGDGGGGGERPRELELELDLTPHEIDLPLLGVDGVEGEEETGEEAGGGGGGGEYGGGGVFERQRQRAASTTIENTSPLLSPDFMRPRICSYSPPCGRRKALGQFQGAPTADNSNDDTHYQHLHHHSHPQQQQQMQLQHLPRAHSSSLGSSSSSLSQNQQAQQPSQQQQLKQQQIQLQQHQQVPSSSVLRQHQQPQYQHLHYQHLQHHSAAPPTTTAFPANNNPSLSLSLSLSEQKHAVNTAAREKAHHLHHQQYLATRKQVQQLGHTAPAAAAVTGSGVVVVAPQHTMHGGSAASMATAATRAMRPSQTHSDLPRYVDHTYMYKQRSESLV